MEDSAGSRAATDAFPLRFTAIARRLGIALSRAAVPDLDTVITEIVQGSIIDGAEIWIG